MMITQRKRQQQQQRRRLRFCPIRIVLLVLLLLNTPTILSAFLQLPPQDPFRRRINIIFHSDTGTGSSPREAGVYNEGIVSATDSGNNNKDDNEKNEGVEAVGLYKKFADYAWDKLVLQTDLVQEQSIPDHLSSKIVPAKGNNMTDFVVRISTRAMIPVPRNHDDTTDESRSTTITTTGKKDSFMKYARITLLETIPTSTAKLYQDTTMGETTTTTTTELPHCQGIQVLNFIVLPSERTTLPVLGIDMVSLPGSKHLLLIDAQPMTSNGSVWYNHWKTWYETHVLWNNNNNNSNKNDNNDNMKFPWGGDFPDQVQKYVSPYPLWTRLQDMDDPIQVIQSNVWEAFKEHVDLYLELLASLEWDPSSRDMVGENGQAAYLDYRRTNDPAKPMLNALFGKGWTDELLNQVLFPPDLFRV
jgi:hypothetical protein